MYAFAPTEIETIATRIRGKNFLTGNSKRLEPIFLQDKRIS
jgi:hypothetical protein